VHKGVWKVLQCRNLITLVILCLFLFSSPIANATELTTDFEEAKEIAKQAYIFAYPMLEDFKTMIIQAIDPGLFSMFYHKRELRGPDYREVVRPNNDSIYSRLWLDLRSEPVVVSVPAVEDRYYSFEMIDMYTHNFAYVGTRTTGTGPRTFVISGPFWQDSTPPGVDDVFRSEGNFVLCLVRIAVDMEVEGDLEKVLAIQDEHEIQSLSSYLGKEPLPAPDLTIFPTYDKTKAESAEFISYFNFLLGQLQIHPSEKDLIEQFGKIGIGPNLPFDVTEMPSGIREAVEEGIKQALEIIENPGKMLGISKNGWNLSIFGNREEMQGKYELRAVAAYRSLYGNSLEEAYCPNGLVDGDGDAFDGSKFKYVLSFNSDEVPAVEPKGFWSITMYGEDQFLVANQINRYSIGDRTDMKYEEDGSLVIYIQHESPGADKQSNWLPAPDGIFSLTMRLYLPSREMLDSLSCLVPVRKSGAVDSAGKP
jgi:hypothetical protein